MTRENASANGRKRKLPGNEGGIALRHAGAATAKPVGKHRLKGNVFVALLLGGMLNANKD